MFELEGVVNILVNTFTVSMRSLHTREADDFVSVAKIRARIEVS
jgi:hypothetical protein